jgi:hypothetical protein
LVEPRLKTNSNKISDKITKPESRRNLAFWLLVGAGWKWLIAYKIGGFGDVRPYVCKN